MDTLQTLIDFVIYDSIVASALLGYYLYMTIRYGRLLTLGSVLAKRVKVKRCPKCGGDLT